MIRCVMTTNSIFTCRKCASRKYRVLWALGESPYGDLYKDSLTEARQLGFNDLTLVRCEDCRLLQLLNNTDTNLLYRDYLYNTSVTNALGKQYEEIAEDLRCRANLSADEFVLEIGSNDGSFLENFTKRGIKCVGVDPASNANVVASSKGVKTIDGFFDEDAIEKISRIGKPKLIICNYVIANVPDLKAFFGCLSKITTDSTMISVITGYHHDQFQIGMFEYVDHDHLTYLTIKDVTELAKRIDFNVVHAKRLEHKGGSIHLLLCSDNSQFVVSPDLEQLRQREGWLEEFGDSTILALASETASRMRLVREILQTYSKLGFELMGIGASMSTTYFLTQLRYPDLKIVLYDDDERKINKYSPKFGFPVRKLEQLKDFISNNNNLAILFAWQHTNKLLSRLKEEKFKGIVLIPLPEPRIEIFE